MVMEMMMEMMMAVAEVDAVPRVDDPTEGEAEGEDDDGEDPYDPPGYLGHAPIPPHYLALEDLGVLGVSLEPWVKRMYNDVYG